MLTDERISELAHRKAWRYKHSSDPAHSDTYTFNAHTVVDFVRAIEALVRAECVPQWISVEDGLPPNDGDVLVWHRFNKCASVDRWSVQREDPLGMGGPTIETGYEWDEHHFEEISHWAPLPAAPGITAPTAREPSQ